MPRLSRSLAAAAILFSLASCDTAPAPSAAPLAGASIGAPFTLDGEDGKPVSWSDFDGRYRIVYFGYTYCPDVCPTDMARTAQGWKLFDQQNPEFRNEIAGLFVSIDPERDTPEVLRQFTDAFDPRFVGVTGTGPQIEKVARDFGVYAAKGEESEGGGYLVNHTNVVYLFDRDGKPLATLPTDQDGEAIAAELAKWVR